MSVTTSRSGVTLTTDETSNTPSPQSRPGLVSITGDFSRGKLWTGVLVAFAGVLTVAFFFRYQIVNGFTVLSGNRYDQVIELAILEHWFNTLRGLAHWSETNYFYPFTRTIGYNDGYFLYGLIYSAFRAVNLDPYLSGDLVSVVVRFVGFVGFYLAVRRLLGLRPGWSTLSAIVFTLSNNAFVQAHHAQLLGVGFAPAMAVLLGGFVESLRAGRRCAVVLWGAAAACLYSAWLMTGFYMAWYFALFSVAMGLAYAGLAGRAGLRAGWHVVRQQIAPLAAVLLVLVLTALPFLSVYLAKAKETGMHPYRGVVVNTLSLPDLMHIGEGNLLFGRIATAVNHAIRPAMPAWSERMTGFPPILLVFFAAGLVLVLRNPRALGTARVTMLRAMALATLATWALAFNIDGHSLWWFVYELVPGGKAARVVSRYQIFIAGPVIGIAVAYLAASASRIVTPVLLVVCALLVAEEVNSAPTVALDRMHEVARLGAVPPPHADCNAFFVSRARPEPLLDDAGWDGFYSHNVDAMIIAETIHLPTINGASTFQPPHWNLVNPDSPDYFDRVGRFAAANHVTQLCGLDLTSMRWSHFLLPAVPGQISGPPVASTSKP